MESTLAQELQADFWLTQLRRLQCEDGERPCGPHPLDYCSLDHLTPEEIEEAREAYAEHQDYWREVGA